MKITDKMRLDWLTKQVRESDFIVIGFDGDRSGVLRIEAMGPTPRMAIDIQIRYEAKKT